MDPLGLQHDAQNNATDYRVSFNVIFRNSVKIDDIGEMKLSQWCNFIYFLWCPLQTKKAFSIFVGTHRIDLVAVNISNLKMCYLFDHKENSRMYSSEEDWICLYSLLDGKNAFTNFIILRSISYYNGQDWLIILLYLNLVRLFHLYFCAWFVFLHLREDFLPLVSQL